MQLEQLFNSLSATAEYIRDFLKVTTSATAENIRQNRFLTVDYSVRSVSPPQKIPDMSGPPTPRDHVISV